MSSVLLSWPRGRLQDVVHPEDHLRGLGGLHQHLPLDTEALCDPQSGHTVNLALVLKILHDKQLVTVVVCDPNFVTT